MSEAATMGWRSTGSNVLVDGSSALVATDWPAPRPPMELVPEDRSVPPLVEPEVARRAALVAVAVAAAFAVLSLLSGMVWTAPAEVPDDAVVVVVESGDTLWSVVRDAVPSGEIGSIVAELDAERGGRALQVGEVVVVDLS